MSDLAIIIVSWNVRDLLERCLHTVEVSLAGSVLTTRIIVIDNASSDGSAAMVRTRYPAVELIESGANLGFAAGNNLALRALLAEPVPPAAIMLLNPDTEIVGDAISRLYTTLFATPDTAVVGPRLRYPDGVVQSSRRRFPTPGVYFWESTPLEQRWPKNPWARRYRYADAADIPQQVDWLVGAALMLRTAVIERAGLLDEGFRMYSEELEWQRRINASGGRVRYDPAAEIIHHEGKSSEQAPARRYIDFQRSRMRDMRMTYGAAYAFVLWCLLIVLYACEAMIEALKWAIGHRRVLRTQRVRVYLQVLRGLAGHS